MIIIGIASANRPEAIRQLIPTLRKQSINKLDETKIVIFNGTKKQDLDVYNEYKKIELNNSDIEFIHQEGGPALGRKLLREKCKTDDYFILLDDDTFPKREKTLENMILYLENNKGKCQIVSGIWECEKQSHRAYGERLSIESNIAIRKPLRELGTHEIHIPLATLAARGEDIFKISFDPEIEFYGDMFDIGMSILTNDIKCQYNSEIVFEHKNIKNDSRVVFTRPNSQWQYLSEKWNVSIFQGDMLSSPSKTKKTKNKEKIKKAFIVEFNKYHYETIPAYVGIFKELNFDIKVILTKNSLGVEKEIEKYDPSAEIFQARSKEEILNYLEDVASSEDICFINSSGFINKKDGMDGIYHCVYIDDIINLNIFRKSNILALHHDAKKIMSSQAKSVHQLCLQPMMAKIHKLECLIPLETKECSSKQIKEDGKFIVAGMIDPSRRDYNHITDEFISAVERAKNKNKKLDICGPVPYFSQGYTKELIKKITNRKANNFIKIPDIQGNKIINSEFNYRLDSSSFIILGTDPLNPEHSNYLRNKGSGTIGLILKHNLIPICHKHFATAYGLNSIAITYDEKDRNLSDALLECMNMPRERLLKIQNEINTLKKDINNKNIQTLNRILKIGSNKDMTK